MPRRALRAVPTPAPESPSTARASFPSPRQAKAISLNPKTYPPYVKWAVDYDYTKKLSQDERIWLAAFSEEYYKAWRRKDETQILPPDALRQANAEHAQRRRIRPTDAAVREPHEVLGNDNSQGQRCRGGPTVQEYEAAAKGLQEHELRARNVVEDEMVRWLDRPRRVK